MHKTVKRIWAKLSHRCRVQFAFLYLLMLVSGVAEFFSLGAIIPFIAVLVDPDKALSNPVFGSLISFICELSSFFRLAPTHIPDSQPLIPSPHLQSLSFGLSSSLILPVLAAAFALAALTSGAIRLFLLWANNRIANSAGIDLSLEVYRRTLFQPYSVHISQNTSVTITNITFKVGQVITTLSSCLTIGTSAAIIIPILIALIAINPQVALIASLSLGLSYLIIAKFTRKKMLQNSTRIDQEETQVLKALQEGLGGIRDVLIDGTQPTYCHIYKKADARLRQAKASIAFIGQSPRPIMESIGLVLFAGLALDMTYRPQGGVAALPVLGALAFGAQRLLPALQQGYAAWNAMLGSQVSTNEILELLDQPLPPEASEPIPAPLPFKKSIQFDSVNFRYSSQNPWVLNNLSFKVLKGTRAGFVGKTGSGKSTCLDLMMGLLEPTTGQILVDGIPLGSRNIRAWQKNIAHVPQNIYLADTTLAENIAFGSAPEKINFKRVKEAARQANISEFIESSPLGYQTLVGERGIRLSGGQRQRIGIARALYKQAQVLVFDEATSALDHETEQAVMESIGGLDAGLTILIIAHRISTLKNCTQIIELG